MTFPPILFNILIPHQFMPKLNFPMVVSIDWLSVYCKLHEILQNFEDSFIKVSVDEDYPTALYRSKADIFFFENGKPIRFCEITFAPRVKTIPPGSAHLRIYNEQLYTSKWFERYCIVMATLPLEFRSVSRVDVCCDFNKFYGGLSPRLLIKRYLSGEVLKVGINRGYMSFRDMGYAIPNGARKLPDGFKKGAPDINAITWGSKGYVQTQLYCKSLELKESKFKPWIYSSWERGGLSTDEVWRLEFRIQGTGKEMQLLESGDLFALGVTDIGDIDKIYQMFYTYQERYFRFVKADYHVKKTQMTPIQFFSKNLDLEPSVKLKINPTKVSSNRTSTMVCNFINRLSQDVKDRVVETRDKELCYHIHKVSTEIERMFNKMKPSVAEGTSFDEIRRLEDFNVRRLGGLFREYAQKGNSATNLLPPRGATLYD